LKTARSTPAECPVCGADVPPRSRACPACGADERTGWNEDATRYDGLDLPETAFDETGDSGRTQFRPRRRQINGLPVFWWVLGALLLVLIVIGGLLPLLFAP
jgi:predicted nucleic acid-binding Zn ribbon protein